jgi:hypothetical protein
MPIPGSSAWQDRVRELLAGEESKPLQCKAVRMVKEGALSV